MSSENPVEELRDLESLNMYRERTAMGYDAADIMKSLHAKARDNARTPFQWTGGTNAGFTEGTPWMKINPNYPEINAENEIPDPDSVFNYYKKLIFLRKSDPIFTEGSFTLLEEENPDLFLYVRELGDRKILVAANFHGKEIPFSLPEGFGSPHLLIHNYKDTRPGILRPYEAFIAEIVS